MHFLSMPTQRPDHRSILLSLKYQAPTSTHTSPLSFTQSRGSVQSGSLGRLSTLSSAWWASSFATAPLLLRPLPPHIHQPLTPSSPHFIFPLLLFLLGLMGHSLSPPFLSFVRFPFHICAASSFKTSTGSVLCRLRVSGGRVISMPSIHSHEDFAVARINQSQRVWPTAP